MLAAQRLGRDPVIDMPVDMFMDMVMDMCMGGVYTRCAGCAAVLTVIISAHVTYDAGYGPTLLCTVSANGAAAALA